MVFAPAEAGFRRKAPQLLFLLPRQLLLTVAPGLRTSTHNLTSAP